MALVDEPAEQVAALIWYSQIPRPGLTIPLTLALSRPRRPFAHSRRCCCLGSPHVPGLAAAALSTIVAAFAAADDDVVEQAVRRQSRGRLIATHAVQLQRA